MLSEQLSNPTNLLFEYFKGLIGNLQEVNPAHRPDYIKLKIHFTKLLLPSHLSL